MKILHNAKIITLNPRQPKATAIVIDHHVQNTGRIVAVGTDAQLNAEFGGIVEAEDMGGATILPGLTDAHIHLQLFAQSLDMLNLLGASKQECLEIIAQKASVTPPGEWIRGHGWNHNNWPEGLPTAADLDRIAPNNPVHLTHISLHSSWDNSAALSAAGIDANTPDPQKGVIVRDESGQPTGVLLEGASILVEKTFPDPGPEEMIQVMDGAQQTLWQLGITGVHDFDGIPSFVALQSLQQRGHLKLRVLKNLPVESLDEITATGLRSGFGDDLLRIGGIKVFADGALGANTAAMLAPYEGQSENRGISLLDGEELFEIGRKAAGSGLSLSVHAIGDAANHEMLNGFDQLRGYERAHGLPQLRHRIEHVQVLHPDDIHRLSKLGLIASMQPIHCTADMLMADEYWGERARYSYAWRSVQESGANMAFGSDAPVDHPNPFLGIYAAVSRRRVDGTPGPEGWYPEERISLENALHAYTLGAAFAAGLETDLGMLAPGYLADLIVLPDDPFNLDVDSLHAVKPTATMVGGDWVWRA